jgi:hypothetical protein
MAKKIHILDELAIQWKQEDDKYFADVPMSEDYLLVGTPIGKRYTWQVDEFEINKSKNLVTIFNSQYRNDKHDEFVPLYPMLSAMFKHQNFAPKELDLGQVVLYSEAKLTDVISGISGNLGNNGWIISKKLFEILQSHNIGNFEGYQVTVKSKNLISNDYVYFHFHNFGDSYVDFDKSNFFMQQGFIMNNETRKIIKAKSFEDLKNLYDRFNDLETLTSISPKEIFLNNCNLDLFKFDILRTADCFMSIKLANTLQSEKITGFELTRTSKLKN